MTPEIRAALILALLFILFLLPNIKIVKINEAMVVERLGSFLKVIDTPGIYWLIPLVDRVIQRESLLPITRTITIEDAFDKYIYEYTYVITDIKMFCYKATEPLRVMEEHMKDLLSKGSPNEENIKEMLLDFGVKLEKINQVNK